MKRPRGGLPHYVHELITVFVGSQIKHDIIYTRANRKKVDDWLQSVVKFYRSSGVKRRSSSARHRTIAVLQKHELEMRRIIEMIVSFEGILTPPPSTTRSSKTAAASSSRRKGSILVRPPRRATEKKGAQASACKTSATSQGEILACFQSMLDRIYQDVNAQAATRSLSGSNKKAKEDTTS